MVKYKQSLEKQRDELVVFQQKSSRFSSTIRTYTCLSLQLQLNIILNSMRSMIQNDNLFSIYYSIKYVIHTFS